MEKFKRSLLKLHAYLKAALLSLFASYPLAKASEQTPVDETTGIHSLPQKIFNQICEYLPRTALFKLACVSKKFNAYSTATMDTELQSLKLDLRTPDPLRRPQCYQLLRDPKNIYLLMIELERNLADQIYQERTKEMQNCLDRFKAMGYGMPKQQTEESTVPNPGNELSIKPQQKDEDDELIRELNAVFKAYDIYNIMNVQVSPLQTEKTLSIIAKVLKQPNEALWGKALEHIMGSASCMTEHIKTDAFLEPFIQHQNPNVVRLTRQYCLPRLYEKISGNSPFVNHRLTAPARKLRDAVLKSADPIIYAMGLSYRIIGKALSMFYSVSEHHSSEYSFNLESADDEFLPAYVALLEKWKSQEKLPQSKTP